jgi:hypothetical protein
MPAKRCQLRIQFDQRKAIPNIQELRKLQVSQVSASNNAQRSDLLQSIRGSTTRAQNIGTITSLPPEPYTNGPLALSNTAKSIWATQTNTSPSRDGFSDASTVVQNSETSYGESLQWDSELPSEFSLFDWVTFGSQILYSLVSSIQVSGMPPASEYSASAFPVPETIRPRYFNAVDKTR